MSDENEILNPEEEIIPGEGTPEEDVPEEGTDDQLPIEQQKKAVNAQDLVYVRQYIDKTLSELDERHYDKDKIDEEIARLDNAVSELDERHYDKTEIDAKLTELDESKFDKEEIQRRVSYALEQVNKSIAEVDERHYDKTEVDTKLTELDEKHYDKTEVDTKLTELDDKHYDKTEADENFYNKTEVDAKLTELDEKHYDKTEADEIFYKKTVANETFYNTEQIDAKLTEITDNHYNIPEAHEEFYDKTEIDAKLAELDEKYYDVNDGYSKEEANSVFLKKTETAYDSERVSGLTIRKDAVYKFVEIDGAVVPTKILLHDIETPIVASGDHVMLDVRDTELHNGDILEIEYSLTEPYTAGNGENVHEFIKFKIVDETVCINLSKILTTNIYEEGLAGLHTTVNCMSAQISVSNRFDETTSTSTDEIETIIIEPPTCITFKSDGTKELNKYCGTTTIYNIWKVIDWAP